MDQIKIRPVQEGDEIATAQVHIQAWQEAYKGLIPQSYLDQLPRELDERIDMWKRIVKHPKRWAWVAENENGIVGFSLFGPPRDPDKENFIEVGAIYLLASQKTQGIGYKLLKTGFHKMKELGYQKAYCWVLENNPTIKFYERTGGFITPLKKQDNIGGKVLNELAYEWSSLDIG